MESQPVLRIPFGLAERMLALLHPQPFHERFAFAAARPLKTGHAQTQAMLLEQLVVVADDDYERTSSAGLALTAEAPERINQWAVQLAANSWIAVHLHSHPPGASHFSATDDAAESQLAAWLSEQGVAQFWSLVWPQGGAPRARLWYQGVELPGRVVLGLSPVEPARATMALHLALDAGRDYLQAGTDITLADDGAIAGLRAEVTGAETGRYCPICSGRLSPAQAAVEARVYAGGDIAVHARAAGYLPDVAAPAVMGLNAVAAGMLVTEIQRRAAGIGVRDLLQLDLQTSEFRAVERVAIGQACDVCGAQAPATRTDAARERKSSRTPRRE
jgi:hypothetical protein